MTRGAGMVHVVDHLLQMQLLQLALADAPLRPVATAAQCLLPLWNQTGKRVEVLVVEVADRLHLLHALQQVAASLDGCRWHHGKRLQTALAQLLAEGVELSEERLHIALAHIGTEGTQAFHKRPLGEEARQEPFFTYGSPLRAQLLRVLCEDSLRVLPCQRIVLGDELLCPTGPVQRVRLLESSLSVDEVDEFVGGLHLRGKLREPLGNLRLRLLRRVVDVQALQLVAGNGTSDGEHRVEGFNLLGSLLQLAIGEAVHEVCRGRNTLTFDALVAADAVVERQPRCLLLVQQADIARELLALLEEFLRCLLILLGVFDACEVERLLQLAQQVALRHLVGVQLQAERVQADFLQSLLHHLEGSHLLGHEQHAPTVVEGIGNHVGDGLALARSRRTIEDEAAALARLHHGLHLRGVHVHGNRKLMRCHVKVYVAGIGLIDSFLNL